MTSGQEMEWVYSSAPQPARGGLGFQCGINAGSISKFTAYQHIQYC